MDNTAIVESDSTSEVDDQTKAWESDPRPVTTRPVALDEGLEDQSVECGIGHRMEASRSVLALVLDEECVFAGLQGGDIVVCVPHFTMDIDQLVGRNCQADERERIGMVT